MTTLIAVLLAAWLVDWVIDRFGHTAPYYGESYSSRTPMTHSILTAPIVELAVGLLTAYLLISVRAAAAALFQTGFFDVFVSAVGGGTWLLNFLNFNIAMALAGVLTGLLHLILDSFTEGGIYVPFKRWGIARVDARNMALNATLKLAGLVTILYVFGVRVSFIGELFPPYH